MRLLSPGARVARLCGIVIVHSARSLRNLGVLAGLLGAPGFWAKGNDEVPDFDNGGQASLALQRMLLQWEASEIRVLPAWPRAWDVDFKLWAPGRTSIRLIWQGGQLVSMISNQPDRLGDVVQP